VTLHVNVILFLRSGVKVIWVAASAVATPMIYLQVLWISEE